MASDTKSNNSDEKVGAMMKNESIGVKNGVELYIPVPENEHEKRELEIRAKRFYNFLAEMIRKYGHETLKEIEEMKTTENKTE